MKQFLVALAIGLSFCVGFTQSASNLNGTDRKRASDSAFRKYVPVAKSALAQSAVVAAEPSASLPGSICVVSRQPGLDVGQQLQACEESFPDYGGLIDARELSGDVAIRSTLLINKPTVLMLGRADYWCKANPCVSAKSDLTISGVGSLFSRFHYMPTTGRVFDVGTNQRRRFNLHGVGLFTDSATDSIGLWLQTVEHSQIDAVQITGFLTCIRITGDGKGTESFDVGIRNSLLNDYAPGGAGINADHVLDLFLHQVELYARNDDVSSTPLIIDTAVGGLYADGVNAGGGLHGIWIRNTKQNGDYGGGNPAALFFEESVADTTTGGDAWLFDSDLGRDQIRFHCSNCWAAYAGRDGVGRVVTPTARGVAILGGSDIGWIGGLIRGNAGSGLVIGGSNQNDTILISDTRLYANNQANTPEGDGISVTSKLTKRWMIVDSPVIGNVFEGGHQKYGIRLADGVNRNHIIAFNNTDSNELGGLNLGNTGSAFTINDGHYGIDTDRPLEKLDVRGNVKLGNSNLAILQLGDPESSSGPQSAVGLWRGSPAGNHPGDDLHLQASGDLHVRIGGSFGNPGKEILDVNREGIRVNGGKVLSSTSHLMQAVGAITTGSGSADSLTVLGLTAKSFCAAQATNSIAASFKGVYVVASSNRVSVHHPDTPDGSFSVFCALN
jgi:hypothetical protein